MRIAPILLGLGAALLSLPAAAQLALPGVSVPPVGVPPVGLPDLPAGRTLESITERAAATADRLLDARIERIERLVRRNRDTIELDAQGTPARRGELLLLDPDPAALAAAQAAGFVPGGREELGNLGLSVVRVALPRGVSLAEGEARLRRAAPGAEIAPDSLHFQTGGSVLPMTQAASAAAAPIAIPVGVIDGAPGAGQTVTTMRGFARGAPVASNHGSAVTS